MPDTTDGGTLRAQLESALERLEAAEQRNRGYELRDTLVEEGLSLVKAEEVASIEDPAEAILRAKELQAEREQLQLSALTAAGIDEAEAKRIIAGAPKTEAAPRKPSVDTDALRRMQKAGRQETGVKPPTVDATGLVGDQKIRAHFAGDDK